MKLSEGIDPETARANSGINWQPHPGPQTMALHSEADELYYGGAAGGGKTDLLIGLAVTEHSQAVIFRREYTQLTGIIDRADDILKPLGVRYNETRHRWKLRDGRKLELGACEHEKDKEKWQGRPHDLKGFDEVCHFTESMYLFLSGWNRSTVPGQRCRTVATGNPPTTPEGEWVLRRWAPWLDKGHKNPAKPGELRWFATLNGKDTEVGSSEPFEFENDHGQIETIYPRSRTFIPAALSDNPSLAGTGYEAVIDSLPEPLRTQLKYGDFGIHFVDDPYQVYPSKWIEAAQARWTPNPPSGSSQSALGVDVARGGDDQTAIAERWAAWFGPVKAYDGKQTPDGPSVATLVVNARRGNPDINVDVIGIGASAYDQIKLLGFDATPINFSERSSATDKSKKLKFANIRAEAHWKFREDLDPDTGQCVALPPDDELKSDLRAVRWTITLSGIQIEKKEDIRERIGRSPNKGDAVILCAFRPIKKKFASSAAPQRQQLADFRNRMRV